MKKRLLALLLCGAAFLTAIPAASAAFVDIPDETTALAAASLQGLGVVSGTSDTTFDPDATLTRAQLCTMVVNAMGMGDQVSVYARKTLFSDVPSSSWYNGYVNLAYSQGLVNGYGDGTFGPDDAVTYGQSAAILLRMLSYTTQEIGSVWPADYTAFASSLGLSDGLGLGDNDALTRGQTAVLLYRVMNATVNGSDKAYYETIAGVAGTQEIILLDTDASYGGSSGLLMACFLENGSSDSIVYFTQKNIQSDMLEGCAGTLLCNAAGQAIGFIPLEGGWEDVTVASATASGFTASDGSLFRVSGDTVVISGGSIYPYSTTGYLQVNAWKGKTLRLYYGDDGSVVCLSLSAGTTAASQAVVASSASLSSLAAQLQISDKTYSITKNGVLTDQSSAAAYDVAYYDASAGTIRLSDYRISGYLSAASPNVAAAQTITVAGCTLQVLESAWETLGNFSLGSEVTLLLTDDGKVAAAYSPSQLEADMIGVLSQDGTSVTLTGSGLVLRAETITCDVSDQGSLVQVSASSADTLRCTALSSSTSGTLDMTQGTLGSAALAPSCSVYEWAGDGYVYDLEGNMGTASSDFEAITWTDSLSSSYVSYYHLNSAGQVDVLLLKDVTGNCYSYGRVLLYSGQDGINLGSGSMTAYNSAAALVNSSGTSGKSLCSISLSGGRYAGVALEQHSSGNTIITAVRTLTTATADRDDLFLDGDDWYVEADGTVLPISSQVELYLASADTWLSGEDGLAVVLAEGLDLTLYLDDASGSQVRIIVAE